MRQGSMYSGAMPIPDPDHIRTITDPVERALAVGRAFDDLTEVETDLRQIRQGAVLELRQRKWTWGQIATALRMARSRPKQIAEGRTDTRSQRRTEQAAEGSR